jgi:hypothetical protein
VQLPAVPVTNKPTPSPLKPTPKVAAPAVQAPVAQSVPLPLKHAGFDGRVRYHLAGAGVQFYTTRDEARAAAKITGKKQYDQGPNFAKGKRFYVA